MGLILDNVSYAYPHGSSGRALDSVSIALDPGRVLLVLGATGSGKSTLLRLAAGLLSPDYGSAVLDDVPLNARSARGAVGLVFQDPESQLFADTVREDVAFGPRNLGVDSSEVARRVSSALDTVGIDAERHGSRSPFTLSGGEARRVAIAGVLALAPRYLLLDEPTAGLDAQGRAFVRTLVRQASTERGVMIVSHAPEEFLGIADRVVLLCEGRVVLDVPAHEMVQSPERFSMAGLTAPDLLRLQLELRSRGASLTSFSLDPVAVATSIARAKGVA